MTTDPDPELFDSLTCSTDALNGLTVGDAFGAQFFVPENLPALRGRRLPPPVWPWTDDTEMACSLVRCLSDGGAVEQDALARSFARRPGWLTSEGRP